MGTVPPWYINGDWFDVCKCNIPCPCEFAQPPTFGDCEGILAWHVREGRYGDVALNGLNVIAVGAFTGNAWKGAKVTMGIFLDERADGAQRAALQAIFGGQAGGWPGEFAKMLGEVRGIEYAPIEFEIGAGLAHWRATVPGKVEARAEALSGPTTPSGRGCSFQIRPGRKSVQRMGSRRGARRSSTA